MKTRSWLQMLALLLAIVITLSACNVGGNSANETEQTSAETTVADETTAGGDNTTDAGGETTVDATKETTKAETTAEETTEEETTAKGQLAGYRGEISLSIDQVKELYTLTDEYFESALAKLAEFEELAIVGEDSEAVDAVYQEFEDMFFHIETQVNVATLIYYYNTTIEETNAAYLNATEKYGDMYNAYVESCKKVYENSPIRDELFADWTEEEIAELFAYSPEIQDLSQRNEELLVELNDLLEADFYDRSAEIYAEIVTNNNRIAELNGYDNYYDYASTEIYGRDYTREDIAQFSDSVWKTFFKNMNTLSNGWMEAYYGLSNVKANKVRSFLYSPFDRQTKNYLQSYIDSYEGSMHEGLSHMFENKNVLFADSRDSHQSAFQLYLTELEKPFCLFGSNGQSTSTIAHEMGHYYAALYNPDVSSYDLAETQSQSNELLLLKFLEGELNSDVYEVIRGYTMYNFAVQSVVCVIIDEFERAVYDLESVEGYTSEDFDAIMAEVCVKYGGVEMLSQNVVDINQYWRQVATNSPVYYISYAVSMVASLSLYATAEEDEAAAREIYRILIEETEENESFMSAVERSGLDDPFLYETLSKIMSVMLGK